MGFLQTLANCFYENKQAQVHREEELRFEHPEPEKNIICRCEYVTETTIRDCLKRGLPLEATDSVKWRCRAGMGFCGGVRFEAGFPAKSKRGANRPSSLLYPSALLVLLLLFS